MERLQRVFSVPATAIRSSGAAVMGLLVQLLFIVSLSGRLHIIWNGEPRFMLIDDQGVATRLLIDESLTRPFGGSRALNQQRVSITGQRVGESPETVRVLSIERGAERK
jgi:hypothetical protein